MSNKPSHNVYQVIENKSSDGKDFWTKVGAAWEHKDHKGYNISLDAVPLTGKIVIREATEKPEPTQEDREQIS